MRIRYQYENLNETDFESLVISICQDILFGIGCKPFSKGRDDGRDSWFNGTAENFPSSREPWTGITIIQAKHTSTINASCSDNNFHVNKTSIIAKELSRLLEIKTAGESFDNYIIFTNRKLTGGTHNKIRTTITDKLKIKNSDIIGQEQLDSYLEKAPRIVKQFGLHKFNAPDRFYETDITNIINLFAQNEWNDKLAITDDIPFVNIDKTTKNELNNLSDEYFEFIKDKSLPHFSDIDKFLKSPLNINYLKKYRNTVSDLQAFIIQYRAEYENFMEVLEHIYNMIIDGGNNENIIENRGLVRIFIHFMYFNCDIGRKK